MALSVDIEKDFGSFFLRIAFETEDETLALLGASGCGKSMTLRCIAGIVRPDRGRIVLNGRTLFDSAKHINLAPQKRRTGLLFQNYALFPNMTVRQNISCALKHAGKSDGRRNIRAAADDLMERFSINELADHYPSQLSGGQQQRTALARILATDPEILLLDEPFSALDSHLRFRLEREVAQMIKDFDRPVLWVSHDRDEVFRRADRIAVMHDGSIETIGPKHAVFADPKTVYGARLTGCKNISRAERIDAAHIRALDWGVTLSVPETNRAVRFAGIRLHDVHYERADEEASSASCPNRFLCRVAETIEDPFSRTIMLIPDGAEEAEGFGITVSKKHADPVPGDLLKVSFPPESILLMEK